MQRLVAAWNNRIQKDKRFLLQGVPLAAVAADTRFADQSRFHNTFRRVYPLQPPPVPTEKRNFKVNFIQDSTGRPLPAGKCTGFSPCIFLNRHQSYRAFLGVYRSRTSFFLIVRAPVREGLSFWGEFCCNMLDVEANPLMGMRTWGGIEKKA